MKKEKFFLSIHVNDQHKKWDWILRIGSTFVLIPLIIISSYYEESEGFLLYAPLIGTMILMVLTEGLKANM